jgi:hypothetical protein
VSLYERCHELRTEIAQRHRRYSWEWGFGWTPREGAIGQLRQDLSWLEELRRRQLEDARAATGRGAETVILPPEPHDVEAEQAVIGAALCCVVRASDLEVRPRQFWLPVHRAIWAVLQALDGPPRIAPRLPRVVALVLGLASEVRGLLPAGVGERELLCYLAWHREHWELHRPEHWAERVADAARRRWVIRHLHRVEHLLRRGELPSERLARGLAAALTGMVDGAAHE